MFFLFLFHLASSFSFTYLTTQRVSSKTQHVSLAALSKQLIVGVISDSLSIFRPNISVYSIKVNSIAHVDTYSIGNSGGFGRKIVPISSGFLASSPHQAFYWGKPEPFIVKFANSTQKRIDLNTSLIPYGETMGCSRDGNVISLCSPLSSDDCLILLNDKYKLNINKPDAVKYFAISTVVSPDGENIMILSTTNDNSIILAIYSANDNFKLKETHIILENVKLTPMDPEPILLFYDEINLIIAFPQFGKIFTFKQIQDQWSLEKEISYDKFASFSKMFLNNFFFLLFENGTLQIIDENFNLLQSYIVPNILEDSKYTTIVSGDNWFAVLEESEYKRYIHIISTLEKHYKNFISFVIVLFAFAILVVIFRKKLPNRFTIKRTMRKSGSKPLLD